MSPYIKVITDQIVERYIEKGVHNENRLIGIIREKLDETNSDKDKLGMLTQILEANEIVFQEHLKVCVNGDTCTTNIKHLKVNHFLQQELEELGFLSTDNFTREEKNNCNNKLDEILQTIIISGEIIDEKIETLRDEIEELKALYVLGKKNWKQQFAGKMTDMVGSGIISELTAKPIIENVLKPGAEFIVGRLIGG